MPETYKVKTIENRIKAFEKKLKIAIGGNNRSVRKTFLSLDSNNKGYITVHDIYAATVNHMHVDYDDLKKLIIDKDRTTGKG
jgi:hypothetical protein